MLAAVHRLLRREGQGLEPRIANLRFDRECHVFASARKGAIYRRNCGDFTVTIRDFCARQIG
jgi:hypothetical protein